MRPVGFDTGICVARQPGPRSDFEPRFFVRKNTEFCMTRRFGPSPGPLFLEAFQSGIRYNTANFLMFFKKSFFIIFFCVFLCACVSPSQLAPLGAPGGLRGRPGGHILCETPLGFFGFCVFRRKLSFFVDFLLFFACVHFSITSRIFFAAWALPGRSRDASKTLRIVPGSSLCASGFPGTLPSAILGRF